MFKLFQKFIIWLIHYNNMKQKIVIEVLTKLVLTVDTDTPLSIEDANDYMCDMYMRDMGYSFTPGEYNKDEDDLTVDEKHTEILNWNVQTISNI